MSVCYSRVGSSFLKEKLTKRIKAQWIYPTLFCMSDNIDELIEESMCACYLRKKNKWK